MTRKTFYLFVLLISFSFISFSFAQVSSTGSANTSSLNLTPIIAAVASVGGAVIVFIAGLSCWKYHKAHPNASAPRRGPIVSRV
jgi:fucose permease